MRDEIIKRNLITTILSLLIFFVLSSFATSYSLRRTFESEVVSVSSLIENQLEQKDADEKQVINSFTYNQTWVRIIYASNSGLVILDSYDDNETGQVNRLEEEKLSLLKNVETKDRIYIEDEVIYYIKRLDSGYILITGIEYKSNSIFIYQGIFTMLLIIAVVVLVNVYFTRKTSDKILAAFGAINDHLKTINEGKYEKINTTHDYEEVSEVLEEVNQIYENIYDYILQINKEKNKIKFVIKNMNQGIVIVNETHEIQLINEFAKSVFANKEKYYVNIDELASKEVISKIDECFKDKKNCFFDLTDKNKEKIYSYVMSYQTYKEDEKSEITPMLVIVITDVTNDRNNDKLKAEFIANASHELKTPITSITGFSEMLLMNEEKYDEITKKYLKIINKESQRMTEIINDMLYLSNLQQKLNVAEENENINVLELVCSVFDEFESKINKKNINVINNVKKVYINNNYNLLKHVISNIVENAIKYNKDNGKIIASLIEKENAISLIFEDTGIGIESKNLDKIFDRFYREDESHNRKNSGSGLGLYIVKQICDIINAKVEVESTVGKGSKFIIKLNKKG